MKRTLTLTTLAALALCLAGCQSANRIAPPLVRLGVATGATYGLMEHPEALPAVKASAAIICSQASGTNLAPAEIVSAVNAYTEQTAESVFIVNAALSLYTLVWNGYGAEAVRSIPELQAYLQATCAGLQDALASHARDVPSFGLAETEWPLVRVK